MQLQRNSRNLLSVHVGRQGLVSHPRVVVGYPKKVADDIRMTRLHRLIRRMFRTIGSGVKLSGYCTRHGDRLLQFLWKSREKGHAKDLDSSPHVYALRHFPVQLRRDKRVSELVEVEKENTRSRRGRIVVWRRGASPGKIPQTRSWKK